MDLQKRVDELFDKLAKTRVELSDFQNKEQLLLKDIVGIERAIYELETLIKQEPGTKK